MECTAYVALIDMRKFDQMRNWFFFIFLFLLTSHDCPSLQKEWFVLRYGCFLQSSVDWESLLFCHIQRIIEGMNIFLFPGTTPLLLLLNDLLLINSKKSFFEKVARRNHLKSVLIYILKLLRINLLAPTTIRPETDTH